MMCQKIKKLNNRNNIYIIIALQFALLFLIFNPLSNYEVTSFEDRIMGNGLMSNVDVTKRVNSFYILLFAIIPIAVVLIYKLLKKVLDKTNWRDSTIVNILQNEIYKGDFVHGKRTNHPTFYEDVVEPIVSKEMWEDCQVQKKKNSRAFKRTLTYLYLQKLKCPKCGRILGGKATTKKNGKSYFYYYCNDCKIEFKEKLINDYFNQFIAELIEYDEVVNQFFLPMIKQKFDEPKEQLEKEINNQKNKLERIKKAYINGVFELKEYNEEKKIVEKAITELETKLDTTDSVEELRFTPKDILLKRDIDFINKIKLDKEYQARTRTWKDYTREEQAELIMKYVDDIELDMISTVIAVKQINFRSTFYNDFNEYIDSKRDAIYELCSKLYAKGVLDGVGMQSHLDVGYPSVSLYTQALDKFSSIGCEIHITELDITTTQGDEKQAEIYKGIFDAAKKYSDNVTSLTLWGTQDGMSWRGDRTPLIFDSSYQPKPAYYAIVEGMEVETETTTAEPTIIETDIVYGDTNLSGNVEIADAIAVMAYVTNSEKNQLTAEQINCADVYQRGDGIAVTDAVSIQKYLTKLITELPES